LIRAFQTIASQYIINRELNNQNPLKLRVYFPFLMGNWPFFRLNSKANCPFPILWHGSGIANGENRPVSTRQEGFTMKNRVSIKIVAVISTVCFPRH
jgi:hypothetical protein